MRLSQIDKVCPALLRHNRLLLLLLLGRNNGNAAVGDSLLQWFAGLGRNLFLGDVELQGLGSGVGAGDGDGKNQ